MPVEPPVTVLLSVHNDLRFLPEAVESILTQSLGDFEFLIFDDASTDGSGEYLRSLRDPRIVLLRNEQNLGLTRTLNRGLERARGKYIARMDADDVALGDRLRRQVEVLEADPGIGIVGSGRVLIDEAGAVVAEARAVADDLRIRWKCLLGNPFAHPTVVLRRDVLRRHELRYDESFRTAQDYELWPRLLRVARGANVPEPLLKYRLRDGISKTNKPDQLRNHDRIAYAAVRTLLPDFPLGQGELTELRGRYGGFSVREPGMDPAEPKWVEKYRRMLEAFASSRAGDVGLDELVAEQRAMMKG